MELASIRIMNICATPPPKLPQPAAAVFAVPSTIGTIIMTEHQNWLVKKVLPAQPMKKRISADFSVFCWTPAWASSRSSTRRGAEVEDARPHLERGEFASAKALEMLLALRRGRIQPFTNSIVVLPQEIICNSGKAHTEVEDWQIFFGKRPEAWRGTAIVHPVNARHSRGRILPGAVSCEARITAFMRVTTSLSPDCFSARQHLTSSDLPIAVAATQMLHQLQPQGLANAMWDSTDWALDVVM
eukprot:s4305_g4.t1